MRERALVRQLAEDARVGHSRAEEHLAVVRAQLAELGQMRHVDQGLRTDLVEVDLDHEVGAAGDRDGLRFRRAALERLDATYSRTFARHSSAVPDAVSICTTSSGTSAMAFRICSGVAGHVSSSAMSSSSDWSTPLALPMCGC